MEEISCIIPVYNEAKYIRAVLTVVTQLPFREIIVIDDCSTDNTADIVREFAGITLLSHNKNEGKSSAIADGIVQSSGTYILMIDGDLIGLQAKNIEELTTPLLTHKADITISYRANTPSWQIKFVGIDTLSGERCFKRVFLRDHTTAIKALPGYGLEVYINELIVQQKMRIASVGMPNVKIPFKPQKLGLFRGVVKELGIWKNIFTVVSVRQLTHQILAMKKLIVW
jgi:glycosyltransferase involved in cell wall biosynthesis